MSPEEYQRIDCKCWLCAKVTIPSKVYGPNICLDCLPGYLERKFVFDRPKQEDMEALFVDKRGMTCMS